MAISQQAGKPVDPSTLVDVDALLARVPRHDARSDRSGPARRLRDLRPPRFLVPWRVQRGPHPGHHRGDLPLSRPAWLRRAAVPRPATPTPCPSRRPGPRSGCSSRTASTSGSTPPTATRRRRRCPRDHHRQPRPGRWRHLADGIVVTPSHNPPDDGGFKYNPPNGGPADTDVTALDPGRGEPDPRGVGRDGVARHQARRRRRGARRGDALRLPRHLRRRPRTRSSTWRPSPRPGLRIGVDPMGGARSRTGRRSPSATAWT